MASSAYTRSSASEPFLQRQSSTKHISFGQMLGHSFRSMYLTTVCTDEAVLYLEITANVAMEGEWPCAHPHCTPAFDIHFKLHNLYWLLHYTALIQTQCNYKKVSKHRPLLLPCSKLTLNHMYVYQVQTVYATCGTMAQYVQYKVKHAQINAKFLSHSYPSHLEGFNSSTDSHMPSRIN